MTTPRLVRAAGPALFAISLMAVAAAPLSAASGWTSLGPPGGNVYALVADPSAPGTLYAGLYASGVLKSTDGGATWAPVAGPMRGWSVHALAIDPSKPKTLYAGTWDQGVWKTVDGGATWKRVLYKEPQQATILAIQIDPKSPQTVVVATDTGMNAGVHRSTDGGATWTQSADEQGLPHNFRLWAMAMAPSSPSTLYATPGDGVWKSTDGGKTWKEAGAGSAIAKKPVRAIAVDPNSADVVFAGTLNDGAWKSTDGGATWKDAARGMEDKRVYGLFIDPKRSDDVWAGISNGVLRTEDGGQRWNKTTSGYGYMHFGPLVPDATKPGAFYGGSSREGVVKSSDGGKTWTGPGAGFAAHDVTAVVTDPASPATIWVGTRANGVFRSKDSGATWQLLEEGLDDRGIIRLVLDPQSHALFAGTDDGIFKSVNGGDKWTHPKSHMKVMTLALDPSNPKVLYARDQFGIHRSGDGGETWTDLKGEFDVGSSINGLFATAVVPGPPETAFVSFYREMRKITDGGKTFALASSGIPPTAKIQTLVADAAKNLYAGTESEGVYKSTDGAASWTKSGLPDSNVQALLADPASPATLYAAVWKKGVFKSSDSGKTWARVGGEPPHPDPVALAIDYSAPGRVLVGTGGGSVWRVDTTAVDKAGEKPAAPVAKPKPKSAKKG